MKLQPPSYKAPPVAFSHMLPFKNLHQRNDENGLEVCLYVCAWLPSRAHHKLVIVERNGI